MIAEQQLSNGLPPLGTANLNVKPDTSPASRLACTASAAHNIPLIATPIVPNITYQACLRTSQPTTTANIENSNTLNDFYEAPLTANPHPPAGFCDPITTSGATYSTLGNTFWAGNMSATHNTLDPEGSRLNPYTIALESFKRKADTSGDSLSMAMPKRVKSGRQANLLREASTTEQQTLDNRSLPTVQPTDLTGEEPPSSGTPQIEATVVKRNVGGRPRTAPPKHKKPVGPTRLRKNKPVVAEIHMDLWELILPYCPLRFLFTARKVNTQFRERLAYGSLWKKCRIQNYGTDLPDPPKGMKEWDYANLLEGIGCMGCPNKRTRKTYWAFQKRWCAKCLGNNTVQRSSVSHILTQYPKLLECIPHGYFDSWGHYESAARFANTAWHRSGHGQQRGYELAAITKQLQDTESFLKSGEDGNGKSEEEIEAWYAPKIVANQEFMQEVEDVEVWLEKNGIEKVRGAVDQRLEREKFYKARALSMDPPLQAAALERIPAYKRAANISKAPSERSWQLLLPKLMEERAAAEELVREDQELHDMVEFNQKLSLEYTDVMIHRNSEDSPEQELVLKLADQVLSNLHTEIPIGPIDDADFVLLVLRAVREKYYRLDQSERPDAYGRDGKHRLLLDDAKMVYESRISPKIETWKDSARSKAARLFKCPGCTRTDINLRYTFGQLFCHLNEKHAGQMGDFSILRAEKLQLPVGTRFAWCRLEWPLNMPILAEHHKSTGRWDPDDSSDYVPAPVKPAKAFSLESAFARRSVSAIAGLGHTNFVDNIIYAGTLLRYTPLMAKYQTQIALRFAVDKSAEFPDESPDNDDLALLDLARIRTGNYPLFDNFRCKACCDTPEPARNNKFVNKCQAFGELANHFKAHHFPLSWVSDMLVLPSEEELWLALTEPGMESAMDAFNKLFPRDEEHLLDPTLPCPKVPIANMYSKLPESC